MRTALLLVAACAGVLAQEKPVVLLEGLGEAMRPIATSNPQAQKFFDQGLTLLYGFNRYEALRSFRHAAELDPKAVMPLWGWAMSLSPHINMDLDGDVNMPEACGLLKKAAAIEAPPSEHAFVLAAATRCPKGRDQAYISAMRSLARRYPDDLDAAALLGEALMIPVRWKWFSKTGAPNTGVNEAIAVLEAVMRRSPDHLGANHFYIHAVESSKNPERAIPSAQRLMSLTPAAGHLTHMPGHIWLRTGQYGLAASLNVRAAQSDEKYMEMTGVHMSSYIGYYIHNLHFVAYGRQMQGRKKDALDAARQVKAALGDMAEQMPAMVDAFVPLPLFALVRFGEWDEVLAEKAPGAKSLASQALLHWARALAYLGKGDRAQALAEQREFQTWRRKTPANWIWINNKASDVLALASAMLDGKLAPTPAASVAHWRRAVALQDTLVYDEPPPWFYPVRESLGGALLRAGKPAQAEQVFRQGIADTPRDGRMLFGLMEALRAQSKAEAAASVQREFEAAWQGADVTLSVDGL